METEPEEKFVEEIKRFSEFEGFGCCQRIQTIIHGFGALLILGVLTFDVVYGFKQIFTSKLIFLVYCGIIFARAFLAFTL